MLKQKHKIVPEFTGASISRKLANVRGLTKEESWGLHTGVKAKRREVDIEN